jgi:hypothetical protein
MNGVIQGGWSFVVAAYTVTGVMFAAYTISLLLRLKGWKDHD